MMETAEVQTGRPLPSSICGDGVEKHHPSVNLGSVPPRTLSLRLLQKNNLCEELLELHLLEL